MKVVGFSFTKLSASKEEKFESSNIKTKIDFKNIEIEPVEFLKEEAIKIAFEYSLSYTKEEESKKAKEPKKFGELSFEGFIILSVTEEEKKNVLKAWKKKELPNEFKVPVFNFILRKCTPRAIHLQDELGLPFHIPMPKIAKQ